MQHNRVVITGIGVVTPIGIGADAFGRALIEGRSGVGRVTRCAADDLPCTIAAEVQDFEPRNYMDGKEARRLSRASQFAVAAAHLAVEDSGLIIDDTNRYDIGVLIANSSTSPPEIEATTQLLFEGGITRINPFHFAASLPNMPTCQVSILLGLLGHSTSIGTACAAGSQAIGEAAEIIRRGDATVMLAGGSEATICRLTILCFYSLRALSTRNHDPAGASRPFERTRDGFVLGEGSGVLVLEQLSHARARGAKIYAEIIGYGSTSDAYHITAPSPDGSGAARAMRRALARAHMRPEQVDYINAHATGTQSGDIAETLAIKEVFGEHAYSVPVSSTKSMIGHLTSAAGAVEAVATILALTNGFVPATINHEHPDPECDLDYVPNQARPAALEIAMSNSFGFGGINSVLVFKGPKHL